jgi:hypothetical protein
MKENASASHDDVNLVLLVGSSWARKRCEASERKHGAQRPTPQKTDRVFTCGTRDSRLSLGKMDHTATVGRVHVSFFLPSNTQAQRPPSVVRLRVPGETPPQPPGVTEHELK